MTSPQLVAFRANLAANTLTDGERGALLTALDAFLAEFPQPDEVSNASSEMPAIQVTWTSALFSIQGAGGAPVPPTDNGAIIVSTLATLKAVSTAALIQGTPAIVNSVGAGWTFEPAGALTVDGITVVTANDGGGQWWRGATVIATAAQAQTTWVIDPVAGNDERSGVDNADALKTVGEVYRRWGTLSPTLPASGCTITWLNDAPSTDPWSPVLANGGTLTLQGTPALVQSFTIGAVVDPNFAAGTLRTITANGQPSNYFASLIGSYCIDPTSGTCFWIYADLGNATAAISNAMTTVAGDDTTYVAPHAGDTVHVMRLTALSVDRFASAGSPFYGVLGSTVARELHIVAGFSTGSVFQAIRCHLEGIQFMACARTINTWCGGAPGAGFASVGGQILMVGGVLTGRGASVIGRSFFDGDVIITAPHFSDTPSFFRCYLDTIGGGGGAPLLDSGACEISLFQPGSGNYGDSTRLWGPGALGLSGGCSLTVIDGPVASLLLLTGALTIEGQATAVYWDPTTRAYLAAVPVTAANVDTHAALLNPASGSSIRLQTTNV